MCATYNLAYPIVEHCRSNNKGFCFFLLNDNIDNVRQYYKS